MDAPVYGWNIQGALSSLTRAAAGHSLSVAEEQARENEQLRQEVQELRATVAGLESRLQQQQQKEEDKQQQAVAELQATVAAMGAQLQALLLQNNMQQG